MTDSQSSPIRVLHVDDDSDFADLVETYLERERERIAVTTANTGREALELLEDEEFDCIVSDYNMSEMDGLELLDAVREEHSDRPFILFTGRGSEEIASEAISDGVTEYLQKETGTDQYTVLANRIVNAVESYRSRQALAESQHRHQTLVEESHDAVFIYQESELVFVNERACELTGYGKSELREKDIFTLVHPDDRERVRERVARRKDGRDVPEMYEAKIETKSGETRHCELNTHWITHEGDDAILGFARDVSDQKEYEQTLETLHDTTRELMRAETKEEICRIAVRAAQSELGLPITGAWLSNEAENRLDPVTHTDESEAIIDTIPTFEPGNSLAWKVFENREPAVFDDLRVAEEVYNSDTAIRSEAILPLGSQGLLISGATEPRAFDDIDRDFLELLATSTEAALERADREATHRRLSRELRSTNRKIEQLHGIATEIEACTSEQGICDLTVDAAERILSFDTCIVDLEEGGMLETRSMSSEILSEETPPMSVTEGIAGKTYLTGESYRYDDIQTVPEAKPQADYRSIISVPIGEHGVFQAVADEVGFFDEQDIELAELLLSHATEALTRVEREQQIRESEAHLRQQKDRLEEFASIVSHDLRNPLNVAQGNLQLVVEGLTENSDQRAQPSEVDRLEKVSTSLDRMETIIQEVLTLARQGQVVDDPERVRLDEVVERAWTNVETADATLNLDCERKLEADPGRLQQLVENLLRNAIDHGGDDVTIRVLKLADGFAVEDDGHGLPDDGDGEIFSSEYSMSKDGTGLGLAIVEQIVDAHGWDVSATTGSDGGARIEVEGVPEITE
ncbi:GAF domain-containing protein [Halorussus limi]|uniref:histidine kinase n=1 Tax=Halorussus limi TaxID=2938695 RepID=A0A8U0HSZ7_9EURY|nr:GAF domain-containing protein [Halorussus limi]UPV73998.1 GAF domain-containing protein [Halorussus limi]